MEGDAPVVLRLIQGGASLAEGAGGELATINATRLSREALEASRNLLTEAVEYKIPTRHLQLVGKEPVAAKTHTHGISDSRIFERAALDTDADLF